MTEKQAYLELYSILDRIGAVEVVKRLERGVGSGATSCFADREASGKQDRAEEEERSDEPKELAVSPGKAEALVNKWRIIASETEKMVSDYERNSYGLPSPKGWKAEAVTYRRCANELVELFHVAPKPDSEARNERSGRRNARAMPPATESDDEK